MAAMRLSREDRQRLGELAQAATGGVWVVDALGVGARFNVETEDGTVGIAITQPLLGDRISTQRMANTDYIAAVSPPVVLALLAEADEDHHDRDSALLTSWERLNRAIEAVANPDTVAGMDALEELKAARAEYAALVQS